MAELPIPIYSAAQVRAIDRDAIEGRSGMAPPIPGFTLMQRAAEAARAVVETQWPAARRILIACGSGNNAGDGYLLATLLREPRFGYVDREVHVLALTPTSRLQGDAAQAFTSWTAAGGSVETVESAATEPQAFDLLVDALYGTGLSRPLDAAARALVMRWNDSGRPIVALDVPSGLHADSGEVLGAEEGGVAIEATSTLAFVGLKSGYFLGRGPDHTGVLHFAGLGLPPPRPEIAAPVAERLSASLLAERLSARPATSHKGAFGHVLVVGGDVGMGGAALLAAQAALRGGAGRVSVATQAVHAPVFLARRPELMVRAVASARDLGLLPARASVIAIGPGLGTGAWGAALLDAILAGVDGEHRRLVMDADALNLLPRLAVPRRADWILTPHPGEAATLLGCTTAEVQRDRLRAAHRLLERYGGVIVLKGAGTLVVTERELPALCSDGNPGMATAGMGDVLTGLIAAFAAQLGSSWDAARLGVLAHARAGDLAARQGERGLIASDVLVAIRQVLGTPPR